MKITQPAGEYQLTDNQEVEITENNPLLTDVGSKSLPITLPPTEHNFKLLDNPHRIARRSKYANRHRFVIQQGIFRKTGTHVIFSASKQAGIQTTFYLKEGEFYTKIKDITLPELDFGGEQNIFTGTTEQKVNKWIELFEQLMQGTMEKEICLFPVITKYDEPQDNDGYKRTETPDTEVLNQIDKQNKLVIVTKHDEADVPHGYGITPFLRLSYVLDKIFSHFGYTLKPTLWHTDNDYKNLVLLNNTADAIVKGTLNYSNLLPTVEVDKFLDCICNKFNCSFDIEEESQTAEFYFLDAVLEKPPRKDLTPFLNGDIEEITFNEYKEISLSAGTSIDFANPDTLSFTDFKKKYPKIIEVTESEYTAAPQNIDTVYFRKAYGSYYKKVNENSRNLNKRISSCFFTLNHSENAKGESIQNHVTDDEQTPMLHTFLYYGSARVYIPCPYIGNRRHVNTALKVDGVIQEEEKQNLSIMFCFSIGKQATQTGSVHSPATCYFSMGTPFEYNHLGEIWGKASLRFFGEYGLFNRFFKRTDAVYRNAFSPISCKLQMPVSELLKLRFTDLYLLQGQPVILYSNQYSISSNQIKFNKTELRTTRLLEPISTYIDETIESGTKPHIEVYYWEQCSNLEELKAKHGGAHIQRWLFEIYTANTPQLPPQPTIAQYQQGGKFHQAAYNIALYAQKIVSYRPHVGVKYNDVIQVWYEPRKFTDLNKVVFFWKLCSNKYQLAAKEFYSNYICHAQIEYQDKNNVPPSSTDLEAVKLEDFLTQKKTAQAQYPIYLYRISVQSGGTYAGKQKETLTVWFEPAFKII